MEQANSYLNQFHVLSGNDTFLSSLCEFNGFCEEDT